MDPKIQSLWNIKTCWNNHKAHSLFICQFLWCYCCGSLKGLHVHVCHPVDEKHFEIIGPTFSNAVGEFRKLFSSVWSTFVSGKLADCFIYKRSFYSNNRGCLLRYFWKLLQSRESKNPATSCRPFSLNRILLCMCSSFSPFELLNNQPLCMI